MLAWAKTHKVWATVIVILGLSVIGSVLPDPEASSAKSTSTTTTTVYVDPTAGFGQEADAQVPITPTTTTTAYVNSYDCEENLSIQAMLIDDVDEATSGFFQSDAKVERSLRQLAAWRAEYEANGC